MTETTTQDPQPQAWAGVELDTVDEQLAARLVEQARSQGISLVGPDGLLQRMTKLVLESALGASSPTTLATHTATQLAATAPTPATAPGPRRS